METFGDIIRLAREPSALFLQQVAAELNINQAIICKLEKGERTQSREQVLKFSEFYKINPDELIVAWLSDKVTYEIGDEILAYKALKAAKKKLSLFNNQKTRKCKYK